MFVRLIYVTGDPLRIDDAITAVTKQGPEMLREQSGYRGVAVLADRELGKLVVGSYWDDAQAAQRSDEVLRERRAQLLAPFAASMSVELYEIAVAHQARQPGAGAATRVLRLEFDDAADERIAAFRGTLDKLDGIPGFCRASYFVDRQRGRAVVAMTYADRDTLAGSRSSGAALRAEINRQATKRAAETRSLEELDVVLFEAPSSS